MADTVSSVAHAGTEKLNSVADSEKKKMVDCVTNVAKALVAGTPSYSDEIAMLKLPAIDNLDDPVELPKPSKSSMSTSPKLKMKTVPKDKDGKNISPSVAVFDQGTAEALFPKPSSSSKADDVLSVDDTLSSTVVSLEVCEFSLYD